MLQFFGEFRFKRKAKLDIQKRQFKKEAYIEYMDAMSALLGKWSESVFDKPETIKAFNRLALIASPEVYNELIQYHLYTEDIDYCFVHPEARTSPIEEMDKYERVEKIFYHSERLIKLMRMDLWGEKDDIINKNLEDIVILDNPHSN